MAEKQKRPHNQSITKSLTQEVNEAWEYFWRKRGMPEPPSHTNMIFDDFTNKKQDTEKKP
tara:strand:+ start:21695 stop:21874 length:180 start_codon:yes stop_codon:yes gene_type:complete